MEEMGVRGKLRKDEKLREKCVEKEERTGGRVFKNFTSIGFLSHSQELRPSQLSG